MNPAAELVATLASGLFAGAALYINLVEHPARIACGTGVALSEWRPSYRRATLMQAPLALVSALAGVVAWLTDGHAMWLLGAILMGLIIPFTLLVILPTNTFLLSDAADRDHPRVALSLTRWNRLHAVRTALSLAAFGMFAVLLGR